MLKDTREIDTSLKDDKRTIYYQETYMRHLIRYHALDSELLFLPSLSDSVGKILSRIEELLKEIQKRSVDTLYVSKITRKLTSLEAKYDWHQPKNLCLEKISNTTSTPEKPGWMRTAESDILAYSFIWLKGLLDTFFFDFKWLRDWFWREDPKRSEHEWRYHIVPNSPNHTLSRLVPVLDPIEHVYMQRFITTSEGIVYAIDARANIKDFCEIHRLPFEPLATLSNGKTIDGMEIA